MVASCLFQILTPVGRIPYAHSDCQGTHVVQGVREEGQMDDQRKDGEVWRL